MGCASASWRCRRSIRCAAATDTHLRLLFSDLPEAMTVGAAATDTPAIGGWWQPRPRRRLVGVPLRRRTIGGAWRREGSSRSWHVARSSVRPQPGGYGFIRPEQGEDVFVHVSAVQASGLQTLQEGPGAGVRHRAGTKGTAGRQPATTAGERVGLTRRSGLPQGARTPPMSSPVLPPGRYHPSRSAALAPWASSPMTHAAWGSEPVVAW